ncbi:unnamed protein product [Phytophthora lilii]|uniref:Unnamed protein product n=1 Tax=Phytophthora lilii TaxID=2077276 RepID=A0A9W6U589_9STRA|nr:unnamed protein product [Phytophthora lilii]
MSDDPYNFEIALSAVPDNTSRSARHDRSDSDDDVSDVSGSLSSMSGISSDNESENGSDHERQRPADSSLAISGKNAKELKTATPSSSGRALDRANNFLSKYSNLTRGESNGLIAQASRRISLDSDDDEDFSAESLVDNEKDGGSRPLAPVQGSELEGNEDSTHNSDQQRAPHLVTAPLSTPVTHRHEHSSDESQMGGSIESFHSGASGEEASPRVSSPVLTVPNYQDHGEESNSAYNDSFQEESVEDVRSIRDATTFPYMGEQQSVASESGIYEEDAFEEEDLSVASPAPVSAMAAISQPTSNAEANFDYSMDFSDDEATRPEMPKPQAAINDSAERDPSPSHSQSNSDKDDGDRSAFLDSDSFQKDDIGESDITASNVMDQLASGEELTDITTKPLQELASQDTKTQNNQKPMEHVASNVLLDHTSGVVPSQHVADTSLASVVPALTTTAQHAGEEVTAAQRAHVTIIRDFECDEAKPVEMKDASTQFTGNHAAIQTDLVPDGMHNLFVPPPLPNPAAPSHNLPQENETVSRNGEPTYSQCETQPPPPPITSMFGSSMYSMDALRLPLTTSTSIYKQQLLTLQEQILKKKRETERILHDRMTFQYSSLRGTERVR